MVGCCGEVFHFGLVTSRTGHCVGHHLVGGGDQLHRVKKYIACNSISMGEVEKVTCVLPSGRSTL